MAPTLQDLQAATLEHLAALDAWNEARYDYDTMVNSPAMSFAGIQNYSVEAQLRRRLRDCAGCMRIARRKLNGILEQLNIKTD
jgi:hypothetical protein